MTTFPIALLRLAGLPWSLLQRNTNAIETSLTEFKLKSAAFDTAQQQFADELKGLHQFTKDYPLKAKLTTHLSRIRQGKSAKSLKPLEAHLTKEVITVLESQLAVYREAQIAFNSAEVAFEEVLTQWLTNQRKEMLEQLHGEMVWQDLAFIHPGLALRAEQLLTAKDLLNKKKRQTWQSLLKVATRAAAKTSPFAHFGPVAWVGEEQEQTVHWQLNQWLHYLLRKELMVDQDFVMNFQVTPSLFVAENSMSFVQQKEGKETIHRLEGQPVLTLIRDILSAKSLRLTDLSYQLQKEINADKDTVQALLNQLADLGFLKIDWPVACYDQDWLDAWLKVLPADWQARLKPLKSLLTHQRSRDTSLGLRALQEQLQAAISNAFPNISSVDALKDQRLVFCNVSKAPLAAIPDDFQKYQAATSELQKLLDYLFVNPDKASIRQFYEKHVGAEELPLLRFHEQYHLHKPYDLQLEYEEAAKRQASFVEFLHSVSRKRQDEIIIGEKELTAYVELLNLTASHPWRGVILQKGGAATYLTHQFLGHGKMFSRFLTKKNQTIIEKIKAQNERFDAVVAEAIDENFFSANLHPRLTAQILDWEHGPETDEQIRLQDCSVAGPLNELSIWHRPSNRKVCPINYGFQALELRSPLYQTIASLGPVLNDIEPLRRLLRDACQSMAKGVATWPRISLDNGLVLLRKGWLIEAQALAELLEQDTVAKTWLALRDWQKMLGLSDQVFLALQRSEAERQDDHYKPQFFDFANPLYLPLLKFIKNDVEGKILIEEVYPKPEKSNDPYSAFAQEWVIEYLDRADSVVL